LRLVLYTGKGGVGKTTTAAATAALAAEQGLRTLVASADAAHSLGDVFEVELGAEPRPLGPGLSAIEVDARAEMERHWGSVRDFLVDVFRYQGIEETVAEELALLPGAEEITTLLAVGRWAEEGDYDFVVVDCAPTDSALRLLTLPEVAHAAFPLLLKVQQTIASIVTPLARSLISLPLPDAEVFRDAERMLVERFGALRERVTSPDSSVRLVVTPERMVIDEALRAHTELALFELACDAVVMNRLLPDSAGEEAFFREWVRVQGERIAEVEAAFAPLPVLRAALGQDEIIGREALAAHGRALFAEQSPAAVLGRGEALAFGSEDGRPWARIPLPHADAKTLDVVKVDDQLLVRSGERRRSVRLPRSLAGRDVRSARLDGPALHVEFSEARP